jgi:hypothetical protein
MTLRTWHKRRFRKVFTKAAFAANARRVAEKARREREGRRHRARLELRAERRLAHRELQVVRAMATGNGNYIAQREAKLAAAREQLRRIRQPWPDTGRPQPTT